MKVKKHVNHKEVHQLTLNASFFFYFKLNKATNIFLKDKIFQKKLNGFFFLFKKIKLSSVAHILATKRFN